MTSVIAAPRPRVADTELERYRALVGSPLLDEIDELAKALAPYRVVHYNTTQRGGGVAGMIEDLIAQARALGLDHRRQVLNLDPESCRFMARLSELVQGGGPGDVPASDRQRYAAALARGLDSSIDAADLRWIHDIQLAPLARLRPRWRPSVFFSHVDTAQPNREAANYLRPYLGDYDLRVNNTSISAFDRDAHPFEVLALGIDAFSAKNQPQSRQQCESRLSSLGIDTTRPLLVQVSRFGRFKNPWQAVHIYRRVKTERPDMQLALVGAMEAADDVEAKEIFNDVRSITSGDSDIHLLADPERIGPAEVGAFQERADVVLQRSSREGFGLTVTEAMWKGQAVVGTTATGCRFQIEHGVSGFLADDTEGAAARALELLTEPELRTRLGQAAKEHVRRHFLLPVMVRDFLQLSVLALRSRIDS